MRLNSRELDERLPKLAPRYRVSLSPTDEPALQPRREKPQTHGLLLQYTKAALYRVVHEWLDLDPALEHLPPAVEPAHPELGDIRRVLRRRALPCVRSEDAERDGADLARPTLALDAERDEAVVQERLDRCGREPGVEAREVRRVAAAGLRLALWEASDVGVSYICV